jgi:hypothetical protein
VAAGKLNLKRTLAKIVAGSKVWEFEFTAIVGDNLTAKFRKEREGICLEIVKGLQKIAHFLSQMDYY